MPTETIARAQQLQPAAPDEADYRAFCTALSESARGRAFLTEYARRNRNADTRPLLSAIERLQTSLATDEAAPAEVLVKQKLRGLLDDIGAAQNEIEASVMAIRTAKLADLIAMIEQRLVEIMVPATKTIARHYVPPAVSPDETADETPTRLAVVPPSEQPELPMPAPAAVQPPPISLVRTETVIAEVAFAQPNPAASAVRERAASAAPAVREVTTTLADPLAAIMALSEEERLAMFT
jgi:hypothetical protein